MLKFINIPVFVLSFALGVLAIYIMGQNQQRIVYVYPTPDNVDNLQYQDQAGTCFAVKQIPTNCPSNLASVFKVPVQ